MVRLCAQEAQDDLLLLLQCAYIDAAGHLCEIGAINGVGMVFIGPNDVAMLLNTA